MERWPQRARRSTSVTARGATVAAARDFEGERVGFVVPLDDVGTDPYRLNNYTEELAINMATTYAGQKRQQRSHPCPGGSTYQPRAQMAATGASGEQQRLAAIEADEGTYRYKHYRKTDGYVNSPLDGIWLRAPYLHNGSVPTLRDLLEPSDKRPVTFYRGNDVYDPDGVGFLSTRSHDSAGKELFLFDTTIPGNSNQGHEGAEYGTYLAPEMKEALIEYLKTF